MANNDVANKNMANNNTAYYEEPLAWLMAWLYHHYPLLAMLGKTVRFFIVSMATDG